MQELASRFTQIGRSFREELRILQNAPHPIKFESGVSGVSFVLTDHRAIERSIIFCFPGQHLRNIENVKSRGVKPLSYMDVREAVEAKPSQLVFSDGLDSFAPNWWRVIAEDDDKVTLRFCGRFGSYDHLLVDDFALPKESPFFTSVNVQHYVDPTNSRELTLDEVVKFYDIEGRGEKDGDKLRHTEEIYWPQSASFLLNSPLFARYIANG